MTRPDRSTTPASPARGRGGAWGVLLALSLLGVAQYVLDGNLGARTPNPKQRAPGQGMAAPIYSVNSTTGDMQYNRANAFRDPTYNIYQRYTLDRTAYFSPTSGVRTVPASRASSRTLAAPAYRPGAVSGTGRVSTGASVNRSAGSLRAPTYRVPTGRVSNGRVG